MSCFFLLVTKARVVWEVDPQLRKCLGKSIGHLLIIAVERLSPWWAASPWAGSPRLYEKVD